jgi:hypothetical protein
MPESDVRVTGRDRIPVERDGDEIEVYNHVSVSRHFYVNSVNGYEEFEADVAEGDLGRGPAPDYVTPRVATLLRDEFGIDVTGHGIEVVDPTAEEVALL